MTYTTTAAAHLAGVTTDTIRVWCRMGAVKATKQASRWIIDATSLTHRISLGIRRTNQNGDNMTTFACGHPAKPGRTPDPTKPCKPCRNAAKRARVEAARDELLSGAPLPDLTGSPKQIEWANRIRSEALAGEYMGGQMRLAYKLTIMLDGDEITYATDTMDPYADTPNLTVEQALDAIADELTATSAAWWIERWGR